MVTESAQYHRANVAPGTVSSETSGSTVALKTSPFELIELRHRVVARVVVAPRENDRRRYGVRTGPEVFVAVVVDVGDAETDVGQSPRPTWAKVRDRRGPKVQHRPQSHEWVCEPGSRPLRSEEL